MRRFAGIASSLFASAALVGCGEVTTTYTDAAPPIDAPDIDAEVLVPGSVTVTTNTRCCDGTPGAPVANVTVFVTQPDGTVGDSGRTNASGNITLDDVLPGAAVTALYEGVDRFDLVTMVGVKPDDALVFGEQWRSTSGSSATLTATFPAVTGSYAYVFHPCTYSYVGSGATSTTIYKYQGCASATADYLFVQYDGNGQPILSGVLRGASYADGATVSLGGWSSGTSLQVGVTGIPEIVGSVNLYTRPVLGNAYTFNNYWYAEPNNGTATYAVSLPGGLDGVQTEVWMSRPGNVGRQIRYERIPGATTSHNIAIQEIPWVGGLSGSAAAQVASWIQVGDQPYDAAVVGLNWSRNIAPPALAAGEGGTYINYEWTVILPPGISAWQWGDPPAAIADHVPTRTDDVSVDMALVDLSATDGYDALRQVPEWQAACPNCEGSGVTGSATISFADGGEGFAPTTSKAPWRREIDATRAPAPR